MRAVFLLKAFAKGEALKPGSKGTLLPLLKSDEKKTRMLMFTLMLFLVTGIDSHQTAQTRP